TRVKNLFRAPSCQGRTNSYRQTLARDPRHHFAEPVQLQQRRVKIRRDAQSLEFFVNDRRRKDVMLTEEIAANLSLLEPFDLNIGNGAHLRRIERSVEADLRNALELIHPVPRQITQPRFLAFAADAVVKQQRFANSQLRRG